MKSNYVLIAVLTAGLMFVSLPASLYGQEMKKMQSTKDTSTKYTCPHHPEVVSDKPGKCPKCGMDLVPMKRTASTAKQGTMPKDKMKKDSMQHQMMKRDKTNMKKDTSMKMNKM